MGSSTPLHICRNNATFSAYKLTYLLEVLVTVDVLLVMRVLQLVGLDVLPEGLDDAGAGLSVNAKQASQARVQLKLRGLRRRNRIKIPFRTAHAEVFTSASMYRRH